jgi:hypothetical protein
MVRESGPDDSFLTRWSRRKLEVAAEAKAAEVPVVEAEQAQPDTLLPPTGITPETPATDQIKAGPAAEPEPFIEPPSLDIIDKDFDLAHWLKQNVPESWKLAALRRTWETDPFIHGYLNPARDYALDWNTPGGAPGYGPLTESDDVKAMLSRIFGDLPAGKVEATAADKDQLSGDDPAVHRHSDNTGVPGTGITAMQHDLPASTGPEENALAEQGFSPLNSVRLSEKQPFHAQGPDAAVPQERTPEPAISMPVARLRRRGGGAIPV